MDNIAWTETAKESYMQTLGFIFDRWSLDVALQWDHKVQKLLKNLSTQTNLCPPSPKYKGLRQCVITQYTSLIYRVDTNNNVELITFYDSRSDHPF